MAREEYKCIIFPGWLISYEDTVDFYKDRVIMTESESGKRSCVRRIPCRDFVSNPREGRKNLRDKQSMTRVSLCIFHLLPCSQCSLSMDVSSNIMTRDAKNKNMNEELLCNLLKRRWFEYYFFNVVTFSVLHVNFVYPTSETSLFFASSRDTQLLFSCSPAWIIHSFDRRKRGT